MIKVLDLFSGIGGFSLAAHRAGFEVVAHCEIDVFPRAVLAYRFPSIPIFEDVKTLTKDIFYDKTGLNKIDVVIGGSPCQDFSIAGEQRGFSGSRSSLFLEQKPLLFENHGKGARYSEKDISPTITAQAGTGGNNLPLYMHESSTGYKIRSLTPRECERLQGFPDDWTRIPYRSKLAERCPDSLRYKACGNAITVNVGEYVLRRLHAYINNSIYLGKGDEK